MSSTFVRRGLTASALAAVLAVAPAADALAQGNSPGNRRCPQGQVPQGNTGYCIPNPGQSKSKKKKKNRQSLGGGKFRNTSNNSRRGRTFRIVRRNGRTFHVYPKKGNLPKVVVEV